MEATTVAARILQAAHNVSVTPTREEDSENEFQSLLTTTRQQFRRRDSGSGTTPRGRKRSRTFSRKVFIMRLANANFFPGKKEQQFLKERGLGLCDHTVVFKRHWNVTEIRDAIVNSIVETRIQNLLLMSGFDIGSCDKGKIISVIPMESITTGNRLEEEIKQGQIIIIPKRDLPNNLPLIQVEPQLVAQPLAGSSRPVTRSSQLAGSSQQLAVSSQVAGSAFAPDTTAIVYPGSNSLIPQSRDGQDILSLHFQEEDLLPHIDTHDEIEFPCLPEVAEVKLIDVKRDEVVETMFDIYRNEKDRCHFKLGVKFIGEDGIDGGGLTNEIFSIFWSCIFDNGKYFQGNDVFVPHVPFHKVKKVKTEFQILGKILGHMILLTQTVPHKLALYTLTGLSNKSDDYSQNNSDQLLQDFLLFITTAERRLLHKALHKFDELSSFERNRLISFFSANALYDLPKAEEIKEQILAIAEKLIIDQPKPLYKELQKGLPVDVADFLNNMSYTTVNSIWYKMQPTPAKVMGALKLTINDPTNDEDRYFYYLQNYVGSLTLKELNTFLLFVTGSVQMPKEILVAFHNNSGISRRPIAHTCANLIEIGTNYETQQELNREMDCYLNDPSSYEYNLI